MVQSMKSGTRGGHPKIVEHITIFVESCQQDNAMIIPGKGMGPVGVDIGCILIHDFGDRTGDAHTW